MHVCMHYVCMPTKQCSRCVLSVFSLYSHRVRTAFSMCIVFKCVFNVFSMCSRCVRNAFSMWLHLRAGDCKNAILRCKHVDGAFSVDGGAYKVLIAYIDYMQTIETLLTICSLTKDYVLL